MKYLLLSLMLLACSNATAPVDRIKLDGAGYRELFQQTEQCSGLHGNVDKLRVYVSPYAELPPGHSGVFIPPNKIYIMDTWPRLLRHEFMHYLMDVNAIPGTGNHPAHYFRGVCGNLMDSIWEGE